MTVRKHTVKQGETLIYIARIYGISPILIKEKNPWIPEDEELFPGEIITIPSISEIVEDNLKEVEGKLEEAKKEFASKNPSNVIIPDSSVTVDWGNISFNSNQIGIVVIVKTTKLIRRVGKGKYQVDRVVQKNSTYRCYGEVSDNGGMFSVGGELYVKKTEGYFMPLPPEKKKELEQKEQAGNVIDTDLSNIVNQNGQTSKGPEYSTKKPHDLPQLMMAGYRRSRLQVKKEDGSLVNLEMRVTGFVRSRNNQYSPTQTNAGWTVHVGGPGLAVLSVTCVFLDTKTNRESADYDEMYKKYMEPSGSNKYFKSPLVSFLHKNVEYKGFITNDNLTNDASSPITEGFTFSFLVLSENNLKETTSQNTKFNIDRGGKDELTFFSDLTNVLKNPITGK